MGKLGVGEAGRGKGGCLTEFDQGGQMFDLGFYYNGVLDGLVFWAKFRGGGLGLCGLDYGLVFISNKVRFGFSYHKDLF